MTMKTGKPAVYRCHSGFCDFAAPIILDGRMIGSFIGGQVVPNEMDEEKVLAYAVEIGVDPPTMLEAAKKVRVLELSRIEKAAEFLGVVAGILSDMAYSNYQTMIADEEISRVSKIKSDFLANMSHEIRTPMNAVIGMSEMALREQMSDVARNYILQIKSSGRLLLDIINDILDYSKIESGKLEIASDPYMPVSVVNDVVNICSTRIGDKPIELIVDLPIDFPRELLGDSMRLRQCIINLTNNAIKFTNVGKVELKLSFTRESKDEGVLCVHVVDTGIGIRDHDIEKIFDSFSQVDSKRNRNVEGTGLGLVITKNMIELMGGKMFVESEYDVGSDFHFIIPQRISSPEPIISNIPQDIHVVALVPNPYISEQLARDFDRMNVEFTRIIRLNDLAGDDRKIDYFFVQQEFVNDDVISFIKDHPDTVPVLMMAYEDEVRYDMHGFKMMRRPVYSMNINQVLTGQEMSYEPEVEGHTQFDFIAPDVNMLIVDDNSVNLTVAEGLFRPTKIMIDTADSGAAALEKIEVRKYDIILMDHMMPKMDGVEATHIIRRFHREYDNVPIIALTANAVAGVKEMLLREGMTDFIAKPIELAEALRILKRNLPKDKIIKVDNIENDNEFSQNTPLSMQEEAKPAAKQAIMIPGLDINKAMKFMGGSEDTLRAAVKDYYKHIDKKAGIISEYEKAEQIREYTIEVHALKSASRQIGATELSEMAQELENAGNAGNLDIIHKNTQALLDRYLEYKQFLYDFVHEDEKEETGEKELLTDTSSYFVDILQAVEKLDMKTVEDIVEEMATFDSEKPELFEKLQEAVDNMDTEEIENIIKEWIL